MKEFNVFYSKEAEKDLDDIYSYIAVEKKDIINAIRLTRRLKKAIDDLSFMADSYRFYQEEPYFSQEVRFFTEGHYSIFYKIIDDIAYVVRIIYGARDLPAALAE